MDSEDPSTITIKATINEIYAITEVTQSYINDTNSPIELKASFPIKEDVQLTKFTVSIGNRTIVSKIADKEQAKEKVSDAIASGNTGVYSGYNSKTTNQDVTIGNLQPKEKVTMKSEYMQMISSSDMSYEVTLIQNYPCFVGSSTVNKAQKISGTVSITTKSKLTRLVAKQSKEEYIITKKYNKEYTHCNISISYSGNPPNNEYPPLTFLFRTANINKPTLYAQYDPSKKESSYVLNYIYSSNSIKEIPIPKKPDEDSSVCYYSKYQEDVINDTPSLFIFLIDQSGSMNGEPIELVKKSLQYFMQSLPPKSYFQLIGFGSNFKKYNEQPVEYNEENISSTLKVIENLDASLGGTNISNPLKEIYNNKDYDTINLSKNIFLLTDGEVFDKDACITLCREHSYCFRVHAVGLGSSFDEELINECGKQGKGSSSFCKQIENINSTVIECVNKCLRSYLYNSSFDVNDTLYKYPLNRQTAYQDDVINYSFMKQGEIIKDKIEINFNSTNPVGYTPINQTITIEKAEVIEEGDTLAKIIIGNLLKEGKVDNQVELSKKYQVLSKETALYGEIKSDGNNQQGELIQVNLNKAVENNPNINYLKRIADKNPKLKEVFIKQGILPPDPNDPLDLSEPKEEDRSEHLCYSCPLDSYKTSKKSSPFDFSIPNPFKKVGHFFGNLFKKKEKKPEPKKIEKSSFQSNNIVSPSTKALPQQSKKDLSQNKAFDELLLKQNKLDGYWSKLDITIELFSKGKVKEVYEQVKKYIEENGSTLSEEDKDRVISTFSVIYFIIVENPDKKVESKLIVNKAKKYLDSKQMNYDTLFQIIKV